MQYRSRGGIDSALWVMQQLLLSIGIVGVAWDLLKPEGWLYWLIETIEVHRPASLYYLALAIAGLFATTLWLNQAKPGVVSNLMAFGWAFAGTYFILRVLLP